MASSALQRFPLEIPFSWYQVAFSDDVAPGDVQSLRAFGRDLVLFRNEAGEVGVLDAYCPHLGAHLGYGGSVEGEALECPFHGWRWRPDGSCHSIPYAERIPAGASARAYPVLERFGMLLCWFHPEGRAPLFAPPEVPEWRGPGWCETWLHRDIELDTHVQEVVENGPDWRHLAKVHAMQITQDDFVFEPHGYDFDWYLGGQVSVGESTLRGANYGMGISIFRQGGVHDAIVLSTLTPIDQSRLLFRLCMLSQAPETELPKQLDYHWSFAEPDFRIWQHKIHRERPLLCEEDGPIAEFRSWAAQFYLRAPRQPGG